MKSYCKRLVIERKHVAHAYQEWSKAQAGKKNRHRVEEEYGTPEHLIDEITQQVQNRSLEFTPIRRYRRREPTNGKIRLIGIQSVKQQVVDYLAVTLIEQFLADRMGFHQASSVKGKGSVYVARQLKRWSQDGGYCVQVDVKQCYPSISHDLVMRILRKRIRSWDVLYVAEKLLATYKTGLEIGSYFSLKMAQLVLSYPYHFVAGLGKTRRGKRVSLVTHQIWYMDDSVLMSRSKRDLRMAVRKLEAYLRDMGLTLKPWKISRVGEEEPIDMAGYLVRPSRVTLRGRTFLKIRRTYRSFGKIPSLERAQSVCAYWGWLIHSSSRRAVKTNQMDVVFDTARDVISRDARSRLVSS